MLDGLRGTKRVGLRGGVRTAPNIGRGRISRNQNGDMCWMDYRWQTLRGIRQIPDLLKWICGRRVALFRQERHHDSYTGPDDGLAPRPEIKALGTNEIRRRGRNDLQERNTGGMRRGKRLVRRSSATGSLFQIDVRLKRPRKPRGRS